MHNIASLIAARQALRRQEGDESSESSTSMSSHSQSPLEGKRGVEVSYAEIQRHIFDPALLKMASKNSNKSLIYDFGEGVELYLGSARDATADPESFSESRITAILNCACLDVATGREFYDQFEYLEYEAHDDEEYDISQHFDSSYAFLDAMLSKLASKRRSVLVHCQAGLSRSASIVVAYLMRKHDWSLIQTLQHVSSKRAICINRGFYQRLCELEAQIHPLKACTTTSAVVKPSQEAIAMAIGQWQTDSPEQSLFIASKEEGEGGGGGGEGGSIGFWMEGDSLAPPCQADLPVVIALLEFASPSPLSTLHDWGAGDGRVCVLASKLYGCKSVGCELEASLVLLFQANVAREEEACASRIQILHGDLREKIDMATIDSNTIITMYLLAEGIEEIKPLLSQALGLGAVCICNSWGPKEWTPVAVCDCGPYNNVRLMKYDASSIR